MPCHERDSVQQTLKSDTMVSGHALFRGTAVSATLRPGSPNSGIVFRRVDLPGNPEIPAVIDFVFDCPRRTALRRGTATIEMVEHCLSALAGLGIDNAIIDVTGPELPAGDGSASIFADAVRRAGISPQIAAREPIIITEPITVRDGDTLITALPAEGACGEYLYVLDYGPTSPLGRQVHSLTLTPTSYTEQIARARTYSTLAEASAMWDRGLFKHLTPKDMLVIGEHGPIDNEYRFEDEPVRHKLLDMVGDLSLVGRPLLGRFVAVRSGHSLNHRLAREIVAHSRPSGNPSKEAEPAMDIQSVLDFLRQRFPIALVDRVSAFLAPKHSPPHTR